MRITLATLVVSSFLFGATARDAVGRSGAPEEEEPPRFSAETRIVTVDVVVLDDAGDPVEGLTPDDFTLKDEGRVRPLSRFEAVTLPESPGIEATDPVVSSNAAAPAARTFVIVFDDLHMDRVTAQGARRAVWDFVGVLRPGDQVSLVATSDGAWWHARIPAGVEDLLTCLRRLQGRRPRDRSIERMSDYEALRIHLHRDPEMLARVTRRYMEYGVILGRKDLTDLDGLLADVPAPVRHEIFRDLPDPYITGRAAEVYQAALTRKRATYAILQRVGEALESARGRKSILLVSEGFVQDPSLPGHRHAIAAAQRANATIHFLDARGLTGIPASADAQVARPVDLQDISAQLDEPFLESGGAVSLAGDTGGHVVTNTNDLSLGFRRLERESRAYYLLGFEPGGSETDGSFHRLEVEVRREGVEVLARRGYYAPSRATGDAEDPHRPVQAALDSPFDADAIPLRMTSYVLGPADGKTTALLVADVDPRALAFHEEGQRHDAALAVRLVVTSRDTGERVSRERDVTLSFPPTVYEQVRRTRLPVMVDVPLESGRHQARLLVRDLGSGAIGTVRRELEIPAPDAFRISTPILTNVVLPGPEEDPTTRRPRPLLERTFAAGTTPTLFFQVFGAAASPDTAPRVAADFRVESADGAVLATRPAADLDPGPGGAISEMAPISLPGAPAGSYVVVVSARDEATGRHAEVRCPFRIVAEPGGSGSREEPPSPPPSPAAPAADPETAALLERAGRYVLDYERRFQDIVAEEIYTQRVEAHASEVGLQSTQRRVTRADMVFVPLGGDVPWACFRDVFEVDGHAVRDRDARLERLFLEKHPSAMDRARAILQESAAFNIGPTARTVNLPTLALAFLHPANQHRFRFVRGGQRRIEGVEGVELRFEEVLHPTIVRREGGQDLPARGRAWVDPSRGTVLRTEVLLELRSTEGSLQQASLSVEYRPAPELALWVPMEMNERYEHLAARLNVNPTIVAHARYSHYRRFRVTVEEEARLPEE